MGVDVEKLPTENEWKQMLSNQIETPLQKKRSYCIIWLLNNEPVGHSNVNPIEYGNEAYMHLHLWKSDIRSKGIGTQFVKLTLPYFFNNLNLKKLISEPFALNAAPNKTLQRVGFTFMKRICNHTWFY